MLRLICQSFKYVFRLRIDNHVKIIVFTSLDGNGIVFRFISSGTSDLKENNEYFYLFSNEKYYFKKVHSFPNTFEQLFIIFIIKS